MRPSDDEILNRWLHAERDGRDEDADDALFALFEALPPLAPSPGFADRVLVRSGLATPVPARRTLSAQRWIRGLVTVSLLAMGLALPWLIGMLLSAASVTSVVWGPGDLLSLGTGTLIAVSQGVAATLALWGWFLEIGRALASPLTTQAVALVMIGCLLVSLIAFHFLRDLITRDRSWTHVDHV